LNVGGGELVGRFADCSLLDEVLVGTAPVTLGGGVPLLPRRLTAADLEVVDVARDEAPWDVSAESGEVVFVWSDGPDVHGPVVDLAKTNVARDCRVESRLGSG
jgi:hypothetical protein